MRRTLLTLALVSAAATASAAGVKSYTGTAAAPSDSDQREIAALFDRWNSALATLDSVKVSSLYDEKAVLLPTVSNEVRASRPAIKQYFDSFLKLKPQGVINYREVRKLDDDSAVDAGVYTFTLTQADGSKSQVHARYTFVYEKEDGKWMIASHHSSAMPEKAPASAKVAK